MLGNRDIKVRIRNIATKVIAVIRRRAEINEDKALRNGEQTQGGGNQTYIIFIREGKGPCKMEYGEGFMDK